MSRRPTNTAKTCDVCERTVKVLASRVIDSARPAHVTNNPIVFECRRDRGAFKGTAGELIEARKARREAKRGAA